MLALSSSLAAANAGSADDIHAKASYLRAQPADEPAWLVTRADNSNMRLSVLTQARYMFSERDSGFIAPRIRKNLWLLDAQDTGRPRWKHRVITV